MTVTIKQNLKFVILVAYELHVEQCGNNLHQVSYRPKSYL